MRIDFNAKPLLYPMPVLIIAAYDEQGTANAMNAAWGGISEENEISMCLSAGHRTVKNILVSKAFTVSVADKDHVIACDYLGIVSGNKVADKMQRSGLTVTASEKVNAPIINELPITLECRLKSYDPETCRMVGEIVNVSVDERVMTEGKVDITKVSPITFDPFNHTYHVIGEKVGNAFSDGQQIK